MSPLTPLALIVVLIVAPIHYALEYPFTAVAILILLFFGYIQLVQWRARRRFAWEVAQKAETRAEQKEIFREVMKEERERHRAF